MIDLQNGVTSHFPRQTLRVSKAHRARGQTYNCHAQRAERMTERPNDGQGKRIRIGV